MIKENDKATPISVSLSPLFKELLEKHSFSPTEVFRIGLAVMLCEVGEYKYQNPLSIERKEKAKETLKILKEEEELLEMEKAISIYNNLNKIKKLLGIL